MGLAFARAMSGAQKGRGAVSLTDVSCSEEPCRVGLCVVERSAERRAQISLELRCEVAETPQLQGGEAVVLAVKPQDFAELAATSADQLARAGLIISLMAGVSRAVIAQRIGSAVPVVRAMPNLPASIGRGITVYHLPEQLSAEARAFAGTVLAAPGHALEVAEEGLVDAATALSGSGPGYLFYFVEHLLSTAQRFGFSATQASELVRVTIEGSCALWRESGQDPAQLRQMVTSRGGTTEAAIRTLDAGRVGEVLDAALQQALNRAHELRMS